MNNKNNTPDQGSGWHFESPGILGLVFLALALGSVGGWYFVFNKRDIRPDGPIPIIEPESPKTKYRPENADQVDVPHSDKLLYNGLSDAPTPHKDTPAPMEEAPAPLPEAHQAPEPESASSAATIENDAEQETAAPKESFAEIVPKEDAKTPQQQPPVMVNKELQSPAPTVKIKNTAPAKAHKGNSIAVTPKVYHAQLGSLPSLDLAQKEWQRLVALNKASLSSAVPNFVRVDLGQGKGIFYRIQLGSFTTPTEVHKFCDALQHTARSKMACIAMPE